MLLDGVVTEMNTPIYMCNSIIIILLLEGWMKGEADLLIKVSRGVDL